MYRPASTCASPGHQRPGRRVSVAARPGLAGTGTVSFESVDFPGYFLRHAGFDFQLVHNDGTTPFFADATFRRVTGLDPICTAAGRGDATFQVTGGLSGSRCCHARECWELTESPLSVPDPRRAAWEAEVSGQGTRREDAVEPLPAPLRTPTRPMASQARR
ncbi:AbfB domain-containing protein [Streptomyces canus]|uniref:AbfB domain-containing protein n=1 Tax=Streptomyces canus TaxID=58343 RepID=UPI002E27E9B1|nr:AbfB domain-containing protein [Streptomyces canus]